MGHAGDLVIGQVLPEPGQTLVILDQLGNAHEVTAPQRVIAVLGPRDSSTHVCATIPDGGLFITQGLDAHWVAGESGIVGVLEHEASSQTVHNAERSARFRCEGLIVDARFKPINIQSFAVRPGDQPVSTPIVLIGATSTESGKTVLAGKLIERFSTAGLRVGALKATGTGGILDSMHHRQSGAAVTLDNVDAGLITTGGDPEQVRRQIPSIFRQLDQEGVDLIVAELGGDVVSANNPVIFRIDELINQTLAMIVISNDALAAAGMVAVNQRQFRFPPEKIMHMTSPFRNHAGMRRRMASVGIHQCFDPNSREDLDAIAGELVHNIPGGGHNHLLQSSNEGT